MAAQTTSPAVVDKKEIQGDVVLGLQKNFQSFVFFKINSQDIAGFQAALKTLKVSSTECAPPVSS
jgi:hypothetical protein